nr:MAG TPA: hypothetical protein [Caudoviricetes sp.]
MKPEDLERYETGKKLDDKINRIAYLIECLNKGAAIRVDSFGDDDYGFLSADIKKKTRAMYLKDLEKSMKYLKQKFEKL